MEVMEEVEVMEAVFDVAETGIVVIRSFCSNAFYLAYDPSSSREYKDVIMANSQGSGILPITTDNEDRPWPAKSPNVGSSLNVLALRPVPCCVTEYAFLLYYRINPRLQGRPALLILVVPVL